MSTTFDVKIRLTPKQKERLESHGLADLREALKRIAGDLPVNIVGTVICQVQMGFLDAKTEYIRVVGGYIEPEWAGQIEAILLERKEVLKARREAQS